MSNLPETSSRFTVFRRFWKPAIATGAGGTAVAIWFEEILSYAEEILALILLSIMAGMIYLLNIFIFNSRMPKHEDVTYPNKRGEN